MRNLFKPHIVELSNGKFAVRRLGWGGFVFLNLVDHNAWWPLDHMYKERCIAQDYTQVVAAKNSVCLKVTKVCEG